LLHCQTLLMSKLCACLCASMCAAGSCSHITHEVSKGVYLSLQALPQGGYDLKRVRFAKQVRHAVRARAVSSICDFHDILTLHFLQCTGCTHNAVWFRVTTETWVGHIPDIHSTQSPHRGVGMSGLCFGAHNLEHNTTGCNHLLLHTKIPHSNPLLLPV
jgi:hypothetical protein